MDKSTLIWAKLMHDDEFLCKAIVELYKRQTEDEQADRATREHNGVGFNRSDSHDLTICAILIERRIALSPQQLVDARSRMPKYCRQLSHYFTEEEVS